MSYQPTNKYDKNIVADRYFVEGILQGFAINRICAQCGKRFGQHYELKCPDNRDDKK